MNVYLLMQGKDKDVIWLCISVERHYVFLFIDMGVKGKIIMIIDGDRGYDVFIIMIFIIIKRGMTY